MRSAALLVGATAAAAAVAGGVVLGAGDDRAPAAAVAPFDGRSPRAPVGERMRVLVKLGRPSLGERAATETLTPAAQRAGVRSLRREVESLQSALRAKGVELGDPEVFARAWAGFAVTIDPADLPQLQTLGLRAEPVRRFYPAMTSARRVGPLAQAMPGQEPRGRAPGGERPTGEPDEPPAEGGGAGAEPAPDGRPGEEPAERPPAAVALLDSGVDRRAPGLGDRVEAGFDAVRGRVPAPGAPSDRGEHGTQLAAVLAGRLPRREDVLAIRVAARRIDRATGAEEELATTDEVLAGLERAVDPDGDGDAADRVPVALVGVSSPYAGFARAPEAEAAAAAAALGTLVVAPAGNDGAGAGRFGTIGSPAAAPEALAVGSLEAGNGAALPAVEVGLAGPDGRASLDGVLLGGRARPLRAPATGLTGPSQADARAGVRRPRPPRAAGGRLLEYFAVDARPKARRRAVVVPARVAGRPEPSAAARAAAASAAGAAALVVCEPDDGRPLRAVPRGAAGDVPVVGLHGGEARRALELTRRAGGLAFLSGPDQRTDDAERGGVSASSSRGPTYALAPKPDLVGPGVAVTRTAAGDSPALVAGTSVAAAHVAAQAAALSRRRPALEGRDLAAALVGSARRRDSLTAAGAGAPDETAAAAAPVLADPWIVSLPPQTARRPWRARARVELRNPTDRAVSLRLRATVDAGARAAVAPGRVELAPRGAEPVTVRVSGPRAARPGLVEGSIEVIGTVRHAVPFAVAVGSLPAPALGAPRLTEEGERVTGVRFVAGRVDRRSDRLSAVPVGALVLRLVDARSGDTVRELTPPGGAPDLLPGEYAYELTEESIEELEGRRLRFVAHARATVGGARVTRRSEEFTAR